MRTNIQRQRIRRNRRASDGQNSPQRISKLEIVSQLTQICLAIVAVFGYFYTVRPIYQKDRLEEQVAEFEGIIKKQTPKVIAFETELQELRIERSKLNGELQAIQNRLRSTRQAVDTARLERDQLEEQKQFMAYRYRMPDGSPATTQEQVAVAQTNDLRRAFKSSVMMSCGILFRNKEILNFSYASFDEKNNFWPFLESEYRILKEHGSRYPRLASIDCINAVSNQYRSKSTTNSKEIDELKEIVSNQVEQRAARAWAFTIIPDEVIATLRQEKEKSEDAQRLALKKVEQEYGDWASVILADRRVIYKHNYDVGILNAKNTAMSQRMSAEYAARENANKLRKSIQDEITRLVSDDDRKK